MTKSERKNRRKAVIRRDGERCARCGWWGHSVFLTLDHIVPQALGGNDELFNLQLLCWHCNGLKGARIADYRRAAA